MKVLSALDVDQFVDRGWCVVERAFTAEQAAAARACVWRRMAEKRGIREDDPSTWPDAYDIEEHLSDSAVLGCFTDRLANAIEDLLGEGRWAGTRSWGLWPVNFHYGADAPGHFPDYGWHIDGNWFRHTLDCPKQGLLVVGLFSDIVPTGGGTVVAEGSHKRTAQVLNRYVEGLAHLELFDLVLQQPLGNFHELTGAAGDVILGHPFLFHTRGFKRTGQPRFISNTEAPLKKPLVLDRVDRAYSILELSIRAALADLGPLAEGAMRCRF
jgi:hypothetical protein